MGSATYYPKTQNLGRTFLVPGPNSVHIFRPIPNIGSLVTQNPKPGGKNCSFVDWIHFRKLLNPLNGTRFFSIPNKPITTLKCVNGNYKSETDNISREKAVKYRSILPYS